MSTDLVIVSVGGNPVDLAISVWLDAKGKRSDSEETRRAYGDTLARFRAVCRDAGGDLDGYDVRALALLLQGWAGHTRPDGRPVAAATFNQRVAIMASFYAFARKRQLLDLAANPADLVERRPVQEYAGAQPLDPQDVAARLASLDTHTPAGLRDRALLSLALMTGRRASELAALRWGDITLSGSGGKARITWRRTKGNHKEHNELDASTTAALLRWLSAAYGRELGPSLDPDAPLWLSLSRNIQGRRRAMTVDAISDVYAKRLGVSKIHASRHTFAHTMRALGASDATIQAMLGHRNIATTNRYLRRLDVPSNPQAAGLAAVFGIAPVETEAETEAEDAHLQQRSESTA